MYSYLRKCFHLKQGLIFEMYRTCHGLCDIIRAQLFAEIRFCLLSSGFVTFVTKH